MTKRRRDTITPAGRRGDVGVERSVDPVRLRRSVQQQRGASRDASFQALLRYDFRSGVEWLWELVDTAKGEDLAELGTLLLSVGQGVEAAFEGRFGVLPALEDLEPQFVDEAFDRVASTLHRFELDRLLRLLERMGALPAPPGSPLGARASASALASPRVSPRLGPLLLALLADAKVIDNPTLGERVARRLVEVDARLLFERPAVSTAPLVAAAGLRCRAFDSARSDAGASFAARAVSGPELVDAYLGALRAASPAARPVLLRLADLPASAVALPPQQRIALLRAVFLNDDRLEARREAALALIELTPDAVHLVLASPDVAPDATVSALVSLDFDEAWDVVAPHFADDAWHRPFWSTPHATHPRVLDAAVALLVSDPGSAMAYLAKSDDVQRATAEIRAAFAGAKAEEAHVLLCGLTASSLPPPSSATPLRALLRTLSRGGGAIGRSDLVGVALRAWRHRAGELTALVDACLVQLSRRDASST